MPHYSSTEVLKLDELLQHPPATIRPPSSGLQRDPRPRQHKQRAAGAAGLPRRCREAAEGEGDHALREECVLRAPCQRLFQSGAAVHPLPLSASPADAHCLALRAETRPTITSSHTSAR